jgi:hypothetical protein
LLAGLGWSAEAAAFVCRVKRYLGDLAKNADLSWFIL